MSTVTMSNINNVIGGMKRIAEAMPDDTRDALVALTFTLVDVALAAGVSIPDIHEGINKALASRRTALRDGGEK